MKCEIITDFNLVDTDKWEEFVLNHPNGNIFQTPQMFKVYECEKNYEPVLVVCCDTNNDLLGLIVSVIQREYKGFLGKLSSRAVIWGAPLVNDNNVEIFKLIINEYDKIVKKKAVYTQVRNLWNVENFNEEFVSLGYVFQEHLNILVDLTKSEDELWKEVYSRRRSQINKSEKLGITIRIFDEPGLINQSYEILKDVYKRAKLPLAGKEFFLIANKILGEKNYLKFFGAFFQEKLIGVMYLLCYNKKTYEWYIGCFSDYMKMHANDLLIWEIFKWSKENSFSVFDFGGAGSPDKEYGVREYKKKFGGKTVFLGRYQKIHNHFLMSVSVIGFKIWQFLKFGLKKS